MRVFPCEKSNSGGFPTCLGWEPACCHANSITQTASAHNYCDVILSAVTCHRFVCLRLATSAIDWTFLVSLARLRGGLACVCAEARAHNVSLVEGPHSVGSMCLTRPPGRERPLGENGNAKNAKGGTRTWISPFVWFVGVISLAAAQVASFLSWRPWRSWRFDLLTVDGKAS